MTPNELLTNARQRYNAVNDTFFTDAELYNLIYAAELDAVKFVPELIRNTYTTTSVASQQDYSYPTNTHTIKRVTYNGSKLLPITLREDDALRLNGTTSTLTGTPQYYYTWNNVISFQPTPDTASLTIKIWSYNTPQAVTGSSTLELPTLFHMSIVNYMLAEMCGKDKDFNSAAYYRKIWEAEKLEMKKWIRKHYRGDAFSSVMDEETLPQTMLGVV